MKRRIVKRHDIRRREFLTTARRLFESQGYEHTSVDSIVQRMKLAKGAFYHYFDSKEDLLRAMLLDQLDQMLERLEEKLATTEDKATRKLTIFLQAITEWKVENRSLVHNLVRALHRSASVPLHQKFFDIGTSRLMHILTGIIRQGKRERVFHIDDPVMTAEMLLTFWMGMRQAFIREMHNVSHRRTRIASMIKKVRAAETATARILGADAARIPLISLKRLRAAAQYRKSIPPQPATGRRRRSTLRVTRSR